MSDRKQIKCPSCGAIHWEGEWCGCLPPPAPQAPYKRCALHGEYPFYHDNCPRCLPKPAASAFDRQEGGSHYKDMPIQPVQFIHANSIPFLDGNVIKYVCRHRAKNGKQDLLKARQYIDMILELEYPE